MARRSFADQLWDSVNNLSKIKEQKRKLGMIPPEGFVNVGGEIMTDPTYYNPGREREKARIKSEEDARALAIYRNISGDGNYPPGTTMRMGRMTIPINPKLTGDEAAAVSSEKVFKPLAEGLKEDTKAGVFQSRRFGDFGRTYRQIAVGQPNALMTFYDPKLQSTQGKINSLRRYVFGEGGKQLTPYEANIVNALINPKGKSDKQYQTDLDEAIKLIEEKSKIALGGANVAKESLIEKTQEFNTPEEADASGLPPGTVVVVNGRKYQI